VRNQAQQAVLDDLFAQGDFDRRLYTLRAAHPHLGYELDELARAFQRVRDRVATVLLGPPATPAPSGDSVDWNR
jgi:hypothetical protein